MNFLKYLLIPFTLIYAIASLFIDWMYRKGIWGVSTFSVPLIAVGNLNTGGTGKTPIVIYLAKLLSQNYKVGIISRGYKRKTFGFRLVNIEDNYELVGDEPAMMKQLMPEVVIAVAENRILGIPYLMAEHPDIDILILDDAFQQRGIRPALNILLTAAHRPFHKDYLLPFGRLREFKKGAKRADFVVVTKCEQASDDFNAAYLQSQQLPILSHQSVFSTQLSYGIPYKLQHPGELLASSEKTSVIAFAGIADENPLKVYLEALFEEVIFIKYPDHHKYSETDLEKILFVFEENESPQKIILTTEKDAIKLENMPKLTEENAPVIYVLPIDISFGTMEQEQRFSKELQEKLF